jgi:hypothetical protein
MKVKLYLSIGFPRAKHEEIVEVTEDEVDLTDKKAVEEYLEQYLEDWKNNYLEYGFTILEESE